MATGQGQRALVRLGSVLGDHLEGREGRAEPRGAGAGAAAPRESRG